MSKVYALTKRNLSIYLRNPVGVFLSLLSAVILLMLYTLFLGSMQIENLQQEIPFASSESIHGFVDSWVFAGIVMITTFSTALGAFEVYIDDRTTGRFKEFRVSPISPLQLILGYQIAAFCVSFFMTFGTLIVGIIVLGIKDGLWITPAHVLQAVGYIALLSFTFSALNAFIVSCLKTTGAYTSISIICGTALGFLSAAYLPMGALSAGVQKVINVLPFSQSAMLMRTPLAQQSFDALAQGIPQVETVLSNMYGFSISIGDATLTTPIVITILLLIAFAFTALSTLRLTRRVS